MFQNIGIVEIIIIALVLLVLFGGKKLPKLLQGLKTSNKELKEDQKELKTPPIEEKKVEKEVEKED